MKSNLLLRQPGFAVAALLFVSFELVAPPALAHHALGNKLPANFLEGFLSGLAHPIIGLDHFAFVVGIGLIAALKRDRWLTPTLFLLTALAGTGIHLMGLDLPIPEVLIALSVVGLGVLLAVPNSPHIAVISGLGAIAGLFHGYAYGESIVGAAMSPLVAYLLGFTGIQWAIAMTAAWVGQRLLGRLEEVPGLSLRFAGFSLCGIGVTLLSALR